MWDINVVVFSSILAVASVSAMLGIWIIIEYLIDEFRSWGQESRFSSLYGYGTENYRRFLPRRAAVNALSPRAGFLRRSRPSSAA